MRAHPLSTVSLLAPAGLLATLLLFIPVLAVFLMSLTDWQFGATTLKAMISERMPQGVVYTTFHHPVSGANVITTENSDWATNCPEYKVTAVQVLPSNGPSEWQETYASWSEKSRRITPVAAE